MKILTGFALLLSLQAQANIGACPAHTLKDPKAVRMIQYLQQMQGRYQLGSCGVEIQVCDLDVTESPDASSVIADMLIIDRKGFERYIPFFVPQHKQNKSSQIQIQNERMLQYGFWDHNFDEVTGNDERWMIEFVKTSDLKNLEYIEIGYTSQKQRENKINKKWIICGTEREREVNDRPFHHKLKSWWHRVTN